MNSVKSQNLRQNYSRESIMALSELLNDSFLIDH